MSPETVKDDYSLKVKKIQLRSTQISFQVR